MSKTKFIFFILVVSILAPTGLTFAQTNSSFQVATRLIQQQRYEEALPILQSLHQQEPQVFVFLDRLVECHIQLKQYPQAKILIENSIDNGHSVGFANIILGKLYHLDGDTTKAFQVWDSNLQLYPNQLQLYLNTANMLTERREFDRAVDIFLKGREVFNNQDLFLVDVPNVYMQAGRYQEAIAEWLSLIDKLPEQSNVFRRMLIRYNDPLLFDDSIAEIEFKLREMSITDRNYRTFFDLQNWLLFENNLYRRAFSAAMRYESSTVDFNYTLDIVGQQLIDNNEYELALDAFSYYRENGSGEIKMMAIEKMADTYAKWAKYLVDYNLDESNTSKDLFNQSISLLDELIDQFSFYRRIDHIYLRKAELSLDRIYNLEEAKTAVALYKRVPGNLGTAQAHYLDGRLHLAENEFTLARIELTRSNRLAGTGDLAEKSRYFLALTDFYSGDFEFAKIQLKTLGRRNTSYYANDALKLRLWVQKGLTIDTSGVQLQEFADAHFALYTGDDAKASQLFLSILGSSEPNPLKEDALIFLSRSSISTESYNEIITNYLTSYNPITSLEQLLWLKAQAIEMRLAQVGYNIEDVERLSNTYLRIIEEYPLGFYAPYARQKLIQLPS